MRVLLVNMTIDPVSGGGTAERTVQLARALRTAGAAPAILTARTPLSDERLRETAGIPTTLVPVLTHRFWVPLATQRRLRRVVGRTDVVLLMNHWSVLNALAARAALREGRPCVVCPAGALILFGRSRTLKLLYNRLVGRRLIRRAAGWIATTPAEVEQFGGYDIPAGRVTIIPNAVFAEPSPAVDVDGFRARHALGDAPLLLFLGRLSLIKGPDLLLEAFARLGCLTPRWKLVFAGPDEGMLRSLKEAARRLGVAAATHFVGYLDSRERAAAYAAAGVVVIPSRHEVMTMVLLEAAMAQRPVLLTDRCGMEELAGIGAAELVPASVEGLAAGLTSLTAAPDRRAAMAERLRRHVEQRYLWPTVVERYLALFRRVAPVSLP